MVTFSLFVISGAVIATLTVSKRIEEKKKQTPIVLRAVSKGDTHVRSLHHKALHHYSHSKDRLAFWFRMQLPLKLKGFWNRFQYHIKARSSEYIGDVRGSRLLKKSEGISEFFKNVSEIEKGAGEINEALPAEIVENLHTEQVESPLIIEARVETVAPVEEVVPARVVARRKRVYKPKRRKLVVVEAVD